MQWSKLKQRIEERFADSLGNRVEVFATTYRHSKGEYGRTWITVDGGEIAEASDLRFLNLRNGTERDIEAGAIQFDGRYIDVNFRYADPRATSLLHREGQYGGWELNAALWNSLSLSIEEMLVSENAILRALAMLDRRLGKRRLRTLTLAEDELPLVRTLYALRREAEGLTEP